MKSIITNTHFSHLGLNYNLRLDKNTLERKIKYSNIETIFLS